MSVGARNRLRKLAVLLAAALATLGWAAAAAAAPPAAAAPAAPAAATSPGPPKLGDQANTGEPAPGSDAPSDKPRQPEPTRATNRPIMTGEESSIEEVLAELPDKWDRADLLAQASVEINSLMAQAERLGGLVPWPLADGFRRKLAAGTATAAQIEPHTREAFYQALTMAALAAGYPDESMKAARELVKLNDQQGWNWLAIYHSGLLLCDRAAATEAIGKIAGLIPAAQAKALDPMKYKIQLIGESPMFSIALSDGQQFSTAAARDHTVVMDFWEQGTNACQTSRPLVRRLYRAYRDYAAFRMVGVNMDNKTYRTVVEQYIKANGLAWPQFFEGKVDPPLATKAFKVTWSPAEVILSGGKVTYVGQADEPLTYYAVRAGLVAANQGKVPTSQPADESRPPPARPAAAAIGAKTAPQPQAGPPPAGPPPDKARMEKAAQQKFGMGQAFEAAGYAEKAVEAYREVLSKYPDSSVAVKARVRLTEILNE